MSQSLTAFVRDVELTASRRFCRVSLAQSSIPSLTLPLREILCKDIRPGDTVALAACPQKGIARVLLEKRPARHGEVAYV